MKKKGYFEYINDIYPRRLWVMVGAYKDVVEENFLDSDGNPLQYGIEEGFNGRTYSNVKSKDEGYIGNLVIFPSKKCMTMEVICHEAFHVLSALNDSLGLERYYNGLNEHQAYLMGWIGSCINKARLGIGGFMDVNNRMTKNKEPKKIDLKKIKEGEIIDCLLENGTRLIGRYAGTREDCILMIPYILKDEHDLRKWCAMRDAKGRFHNGAVAVGRCIGLGYANGTELDIYKEMTREYEVENKE